MGHSMKHSMDSVMDLNSNLPEMLAVDLEQSRGIFQSRQLTAGAPAPGLADEATKEQHSPVQSSNYPSSILTSQQEDDDALSDSQTVHEKYSSIFAPLDFSAPKRVSISSSEYSADLEPTSISARGESVLTIDTWIEPEKRQLPTFLHMSPTSEYTSQSWINLDGDELSPITQRRRSSMTDFPTYMQQLRSSNDTVIRTMSLKSQPAEAIEPSSISIRRKPLPTVVIPKRRSSLNHMANRAAIQQWAQNLNQEEADPESPYFAPPAILHSEPQYIETDDPTTSYPEDELNFIFRDSKPRMSEDVVLNIGYAEVDCDEWLKSDMAYLARADQPIPRPLPPTVQERVELYATNFPVTLLQCNHLLIEDIRSLSQGVRYNTENLKYDHQTPSQQQSKASKWKWPGSSTSTTEQLVEFDTCLASTKQEWTVISKIFPFGENNLCDALYAYVLVYNYITSLCLRCPSNAVDLPTQTRPWTARPDTGRLAASSDLDMGIGAYVSTLSLPPTPVARPIPKKASRLLGIETEEIPVAGRSSSPTPPPSRGNESHVPGFKNLRSLPSFLFNGKSQGQQRQNDNKSTTSRPTTPAAQRGNSGRPVTPTASWAGARPSTSAGSRGPDQTRQLAQLRYKLANCCARLALTLQHTDPTIPQRGSDKACKIVPSLMRSLCENVRFTEEVMGRC